MASLIEQELAGLEAWASTPDTATASAYSPDAIEQELGALESWAYSQEDASSPSPQDLQAQYNFINTPLPEDQAQRWQTNLATGATTGAPPQELVEPTGHIENITRALYEGALRTGSAIANARTAAQRRGTFGLALPEDELAKQEAFAKDIRRRLYESQAFNPPSGLAQESIRTGVSSLAPSFIGARLGGAPGAILAGGGIAANEAYEEGRQAGLKGKELTAYTAAMGAIEMGTSAAFQMIPGWNNVEDLLAKGVGKQGIKKTVMSWAKAAAKEMPEETIAEEGQGLTGKAFGVNEFGLDEAIETAYKTPLATLAGVGSAGAVNVGANVYDRLRNAKSASRKDIAEALGTTPDSLPEGLRTQSERQAAFDQALSTAQQAQPASQDLEQMPEWMQEYYIGESKKRLEKDREVALEAIRRKQEEERQAELTANEDRMRRESPGYRQAFPGGGLVPEPVPPPPGPHMSSGSGIYGTEAKGDVFSTGVNYEEQLKAMSPEQVTDEAKRVGVKAKATKQKTIDAILEKQQEVTSNEEEVRRQEEVVSEEAEPGPLPVSVPVTPESPESVQVAPVSQYPKRLTTRDGSVVEFTSPTDFRIVQEAPRSEEPTPEPLAEQESDIPEVPDLEVDLPQRKEQIPPERQGFKQPAATGKQSLQVQPVDKAKNVGQNPSKKGLSGMGKELWEMTREEIRLYENEQKDRLLSIADTAAKESGQEAFYRVVIPDDGAKVGDILPSSYEWIDGEPTNKELGGTAAFSSLDAALKYSRGDGSHIAVVVGEYLGDGGMPEENAALVENSKVVHIEPKLPSTGQSNFNSFADTLHRYFVDDAIKKGKPVPPEVLADYPDLQAKYGKEQPAAAPPVAAPESPSDEFMRLDKKAQDLLQKDNGRAYDKWLSTKEGKRYSELADQIAQESGISSKPQQQEEKQTKTKPKQPPNLRTSGFINIDAFLNPIRQGMKPLLSVAKKFLGPGGDLPGKTFEFDLERRAALSALDKEMQAVVHDFNRAVNTIKGRYPRIQGKSVAKLAELTPEEKRTYSDMLKGIRSIDEAPEPLQKPLREMRNIIDRLSRVIVDEEIATGDLGVRIEQNEGKYVSRAFRAFNEKDWREKVPQEVRDAFVNMLMRENPGMTQDEALGRMESYLFNDKAEDTPSPAIRSGGALGSRDMGILMKRKDLPQEYLDLLGEYHDPLSNFAITVSRMGHLIANTRFLKQVKQDGLTDGWLAEPDKPTQKLFARIGSDATKGVRQDLREGKRLKSSPQDAMQNAIEQSQEFAPMGVLDGMYTTPEIKEAFEEFYKTYNPPTWLRALLIAQSYVKFGKTVASPVGTVRNFVGNAPLAAATGNWDLRGLAKGFRAAAANFGVKDNDAQREFLRHLAEIGVIDTDINAGVLMDLLNDFSNAEYSNTASGAAENLAKRGMKVAAKFYNEMDNVWKIHVFLGESAKYRKAYPNWTPAQIEKVAAENTLKIMPNYRMLGRVARELRAFPFNGTFVAFPSEIIRTTLANFDLATTEIANPATRKIGVKRLISMSLSHGAMMGGLSAITKAWFGVDDEEDKAAHKFVAPWQENSSFLYMGEPKDGKFTVIDLDYTNPYSFLHKGVRAALAGKDWKQSVTQGLAEWLAPFYGEDIVFGAVYDIARNKKKSGGRIYNEEDSNFEKTKKIAHHLGSTIEPGISAQLRDMVKALRGDVAEHGKIYRPEIEIVRWFTGQRLQKIGVEQSLSIGVSKELSARIKDSTGIFSEKIAKDGNVSDDEIRSAYKRMKEAKKQIAEDIQSSYKAAVAMGVPSGKVKTIMQSAGISAQVIAEALNRGDLKWTPSEQLKERIRDVDPTGKRSALLRLLVTGG